MQKYHILTYGCQMNYADSERFSTMLNQAGLENSAKLEKADLIIINTCSVRQKAEDRIIGLGRKLAPLKTKNKNLQIVLTGCMARRSWSDTNSIFSKNSKYFSKLFKDMPWLDKVLETRKFPTFLNDLKTAEFFDFKQSPNNPIHGLVPISFGCNHFCTYCIVPFSRGQEICRPFGDIYNEYKSLVESGFKDITLLGQTVNRWINPKFRSDFKIESVAAVKIPKLNKTRFDIESKTEPKDFLQLLEKLDSIEGDYWVNFVSSHPNYMTKEIVDFLATSKHIRPYFHFALQSGSNRILAKMNRRHKYEDFKKIALYYKSKLPYATLSIDIIVGFPGESEDDFKKTVSAMSELKFDAAYISEFSPRKGTPAANIPDDVPRKTKADRKAYLNDIILAKTALENNTKLVGKVFKCLIESSRNGISFGRLANNKEIRIRAKEMPNTFINVKIISCTPWALEGQVLK